MDEDEMTVLGIRCRETDLMQTPLRQQITSVHTAICQVINEESYHVTPLHL